MLQDFFITRKYKRKIGEFKKDFNAVKDRFYHAVDLETAKNAKQIREVVEQTKEDVEFLRESSRSTKAVQSIIMNATVWVVSSAKVRAESSSESTT